MEEVIRGDEKAAVKANIVDFSNEERFVTVLRIDKLLASAEGDREMALNIYLHQTFIK